MSKRKILTVIVLLAAMLALQVGSAFAAPAKQDATPTAPVVGTVQTVTVETDPTTMETTVVVTVLDSTGTTQTVRLSTADAESLGLVTLDTSTNTYVAVDPTTLPEVSIDPALIIPDTTAPVEEAQHPVGSALSDFFSEVLGVDYDAIMAAHDEGAGFGVIAQALWLTNAMEGDAELFDTIIQAKMSNDFSSITLPDGSTPANWGQFRKALLDHKQNLGQIMSGHAEPLTGDGMQAQSTHGNGHGNNKDKSNKSNNGHGPNK